MILLTKENEDGTPLVSKHFNSIVDYAHNHLKKIIDKKDYEQLEQFAYRKRLTSLPEIAKKFPHITDNVVKFVVMKPQHKNQLKTLRYYPLNELIERSKEYPQILKNIDIHETLASLQGQL